MQVLLVEDEPDLAVPIARFLEHEGYAVSTAGSLADARRVDVTAIEFVLLDVMLPEGEDAGFAFAQELRTAGYSGKLLFLTARDTTGDRLRAHGLGADGLLLKPFRLRDLAARMRALAAP